MSLNSSGTAIKDDGDRKMSSPVRATNKVGQPETVVTEAASRVPTRDNIDELLPEVSPEVQTDDEDEDYEDEKVKPRVYAATSKKAASSMAKSRQCASLVRQCVNCGAHSTSQWRTNGNGHYLCNACGLYRKYNGEDRPPANTTLQRKRNCPVPKKCSNCGTLTSSMWRRLANKQVACNACGLYYKLYGVNRPIEMRKDVVYPRNRYSKLVAMVPQDRQQQQQQPDPIIKSMYAVSKPKTRGKRGMVKVKMDVEEDDQRLANPIASLLSDDKPRLFEPSPVDVTSAIQEHLSSDDGHHQLPHPELGSRECANCGTTSTSQWRRFSGNFFGHYLCDPCGLYRKIKGEDRPLEAGGHSKKVTLDSEALELTELCCQNCDRRNVCCANCGVAKSSEWRRSVSGQIVCNACGLYYKLHAVNRPLNMRRDFIVHRNRTAGHSNGNQATTAIAGEDDRRLEGSVCTSAVKKRKQSNPKKIIMS